MLDEIEEEKEYKSSDEDYDSDEVPDDKYDPLSR